MKRILLKEITHKSVSRSRLDINPRETSHVPCHAFGRRLKCSVLNPWLVFILSNGTLIVLLHFALSRRETEASIFRPSNISEKLRNHFELQSPWAIPRCMCRQESLGQQLTFDFSAVHPIINTRKIKIQYSEGHLEHSLCARNSDVCLHIGNLCLYTCIYWWWWFKWLIGIGSYHCSCLCILCSICRTTHLIWIMNT